MIVKQGDIFCTVNPMALGKAINACQRFWASDNESTYSHAGIITGPRESLESLWHIKRQDPFKAYSGKQVIIGRHMGMTPEAFKKGMAAISEHEGDLYPFWRLIFHLFPPAAKYISTGHFPVCSELAMKFLVNSEVDKKITSWKGKNPDDVADMIRRWKFWTVIFEGVLD